MNGRLGVDSVQLQAASRLPCRASTVNAGDMVVRMWVQAPVMLRLVFHDAATFDQRAGDGGADASVAFELDRPENKGLKRGCDPQGFPPPPSLFSEPPLCRQGSRCAHSSPFLRGSLHQRRRYRRSLHLPMASAMPMPLPYATRLASLCNEGSPAV